MNIYPPADSFTLNVYVRNHTSSIYKVIVSEEQRSNDLTITPLYGTYEDGMLSIEIPYRIQNARWYWIRIYVDTGEEIYKGKLYCTGQSDLEKHSVLDGYYTTPDKPKTEYYVKGQLPQGDISIYSVLTEGNESLNTEDNQEILIEY